MSDEFLENVIVKLMNQPDPITALPPAPEAVPDSTAAAIARCRDAWQQTYDDYLKKNRRKDGWEAKGKAVHAAGIAYRGAMPPLAGHQGIRDFIACTAYGILMDAIPADRGGQLLYAAQVALSVIQRTPKPANSAPKSAPTQPGTPPPPHENPRPEPQNLQ